MLKKRKLCKVQSYLSAIMNCWEGNSRLNCLASYFIWKEDFIFDSTNSEQKIIQLFEEQFNLSGNVKINFCVK